MVNTKSLTIICSLLLCQQYANACGTRDYACMKEKRNARYSVKKKPIYIQNKKIIVSGYNGGNPALSINSKDGNYHLRNVKIIARNYRARNKDKGASIFEVKNLSSDADAIKMKNVRLYTLGKNVLSGKVSQDKSNVCVASYCQYGNVEIDGFKNINYGSLKLNVD